MRVAVTGATGHIGINLLQALIARGDEVAVLVHQTRRGLEALPLARVEGDVLDPTSLRAAFDGAEVVFHLAAVISIDGDRGGLVTRVNVQGARNAAMAARDAGVRRFVHFCSIHAFDPEPAGEPVDETRARVPDDPSHTAYDRSKAAGERAVREVVAEGLDAVILHPTGVIGPNDLEPSRMGRVFLQLYHRSLPSLVGGGFDWVDVRDVVASALVAAERGRCGESYRLSGHWASVSTLAQLAAEVTGVRPPLLTPPQILARIGVPFVTAWGRLVGREPLYTAESLHALQSYRHLDHGKATRELGHASRPLAETVRDIHRSFAERGLIALPETP